jgi:hypothetical protein
MVSSIFGYAETHYAAIGSLRVNRNPQTGDALMS